MLPFPPTVNHHVSTKGKMRFILPKGRQFRAEVCEIVLEKKLEPLTGRLKVFVELFPDSRRRMDIMNREKPLCDALTHAGVWLDDSQIDDFRIVRRQVQPGDGACKVIIYEKGEA
jgi:crossover junction endodeoxyribonuclease RusA